MKPDSQQPKPNRQPIRWILIIGLFLAAMVVTFTVVKVFTTPTLPDKLVGTWKGTDGELKGSIITFERDGTFRVQGNPVAKVTYHGDYLQFHYTIATGETRVQSQQIVTLNSTELITKTKAGTSRMERWK